MAIPLCRLEGTWQEITARLPDFDTRRLEVVVYDAESVATVPAAVDDPRLKLVDVIAETVMQMKLAPDSRDYLREGRDGGMFRDDSAE